MNIAEHVIIKRKLKFKFTVDGAQFPWYISEDGPQVTKLGNELYGITVAIFCVDRETRCYQTFTVGSDDEDCPPERFSIGGVEFPWAISSDGFTYNVSSKSVPTVTLTFFARNVEDDKPILDQREVCDIDGAVLARTPERSAHGAHEA